MNLNDIQLHGVGVGGEITITFDNYNPTLPLLHHVTTPLSAARNDLAGASVGGYALFGGGHTGAYSAVVDAYGAFFQTHVFSIGNKYNFRGIEIVTTQPVTNLSLPTPINGYIKYKKGGIIS